MDHKRWLWRKKSSERTILRKNKSGISEGEQEEKMARQERSLQSLNEKLSFIHAECFEKDVILAKQAKVAEEAILGWEKAEAEAIAVKTELDDVLHQKTSLEQRICLLDEALNAAMVERDLLVKDTAKIISYEQDKIQKLEEHVEEKMNIIASLDAENSKLSEILSAKEKIMVELTESKAVTESDLKNLAVKLESAERSNSSLRYEVCMLQKQLDIRSEERKFNLKSADASHKQHLENVKKITKLEEECQRLRSMLRKRLPGPGAIAKMRSEVESLRNSTTRTRMGRLNSTASTNYCDLVQNSCDAPHGSAALLARLHVMQDENKAMKESLSKKDGELQLSGTILSHTKSKLSQVEAQLEELRGRSAAELVKSTPAVLENSFSSISETGCNGDVVSCSGSWASALISELEHFKKGKLTTPSCKSTRLSDLSFMDDFEEIEKIALACDDKPSKSYDSKRETTECSGKGLVPVDGPTEATNQIHQYKIEKALRKLIELIEGIILRSSKDNSSSTHVQSGGNMDDHSNTLNGYVARAFLWRTSELTCVLQNFVVVCTEILYRNADVERFVVEVNLTLDWIINHCFSLQDVSDMRETIIKHLEFNRSVQLEGVAATKQTGINTTNCIDEPRTPNMVQMSLVSASNFTDVEFKTDGGTQNIMNKMSLSNFRESEGKSSSLRAELNALKETGKMMTHGVAGAPLVHEPSKAVSSSIYDANKGNQQGTSSLEFKLQRESYSDKEDPECVAGNEEKHLHMQLDISTASEKLIECQETILNLGKQLKALASPKDVIIPEKIIRTAVQCERKPRCQSLNEILATDDGGFDYLSSPKTKEMICTEPNSPHGRKISAVEDCDTVSCGSHSMPPVVPPLVKPCGVNGICKNEAAVSAVALTVVPSKQKVNNTNLLRRILKGRRKEAITKRKVVISA